MGLEQKTVLITGYIRQRSFKITEQNKGAGLTFESGAHPAELEVPWSMNSMPRGFRVFATARSLAKLEPLTAKGIETLELDISKSDSIAKAKEEIKERTGGRLNMLVNNAGMWLESPAIETDLTVIRSMFEVNIFGLMEMVKEFYPFLLRTKGTIVNIGSILGIMPYPFTAAYNASKAAVAQYSETLRLELEPVGIKVITVVTGQVATNLPALPVLPETSIYKPLQSQLNARAKAHMEKGAKPEIFAAALVKEVTRTSPAPWFWSGTNSTITWVVSTFAPKTAFDFLMKKLSGLGEAGRAVLQLAESKKAQS